MEEIKIAVLGGCILGIAFELIKNIVIDKKMYTSLRMIMSLVLMCSLIIPIIKGNIEFTIPVTETEMESEIECTEEILNNAYINCIENSIEKNLTIYLNKEGIEIEKLVIETYVDEYNYLEVDKIVYHGNKVDYEKINDIVKQNFGKDIILECCDERED